MTNEYIKKVVDEYYRLAARAQILPYRKRESLLAKFLIRNLDVAMLDEAGKPIEGVRRWENFFYVGFDASKFSCVGKPYFFINPDKTVWPGRVLSVSLKDGEGMHYNVSRFNLKRPEIKEVFIAMCTNFAHDMHALNYMIRILTGREKDKIGYDGSWETRL